MTACNKKNEVLMNDIFAIIVVFFVFKALGAMLKALFGGEKRNDFRRDR